MCLCQSHNVTLLSVNESLVESNRGIGGRSVLTHFLKPDSFLFEQVSKGEIDRPSNCYESLASAANGAW